MLCPRCHTDLIVVEYHDIELDYCPACEGLWFDHGEMELVASEMGSPIDGALHRRPADTNEEKLKCPECQKTMDKRLLGTSDPVVTDVCRLCGGLWLDHGELEQVVRQYRDTADGPVIKYLRDTFRA